MPNRFRISFPPAAPLMILAILGIACFQGYWLRTGYKEKWKELQRESDIAFRDAVYKLQMQELKKDTFFNRHDLPPDLFLFNLVDSLRSRFADSGSRPNWAPADHNITISIQTNRIDSPGGVVRGNLFAKDSGGPQLLRYYSTRRKLDPPLPPAMIDSAYRVELARNHITVPFRIERIDAKTADRERPPSPDKLQTNFVYLGLSNGYVYQANLANPAGFLLGRMLWQIVLGFLLLALTATTFLIAYRNMQFQRRLAQIKNNFISNMTHELKTPISTIKVAVEALRHFDALKDPEKTREYLDISALELYRLSGLVDKVLRLSQFDNREIELHMTVFDLREMAAAVIGGMRLSFESAGAAVQLSADTAWAAGPADGAHEPCRQPAAPGNMEKGGFPVRGDRTHLSSVLSNLLDNALKYGKGQPVITVDLWRLQGQTGLAVTDNGIGIPQAYVARIFEKFFRVPSGDHHNIKGYGLGLSYVQEIVHLHGGTIAVDSKEGKGTTFTIKLPAA